eukprot:427160-Rhodomonas_salina.1
MAVWRADVEGRRQFLNEIHSGTNASAELAYIGALLASAREKSEEKTIQKLEETVKLHLVPRLSLSLSRAQFAGWLLLAWSDGLS